MVLSLITIVSTMVMSIAATISILLYIFKGQILGIGLVSGEILRPVVILCFVAVSVKLAYIALWDFCSRGLGLIERSPELSRDGVMVDSVIAILFLFLMNFWYQHGGLSLPSVRP